MRLTGNMRGRERGAASSLSLSHISSQSHSNLVSEEKEEEEEQSVDKVFLEASIVVSPAAVGGCCEGVRGEKGGVELSLSLSFFFFFFSPHKR